MVGMRRDLLGGLPSDLGGDAQRHSKPLDQNDRRIWGLCNNSRKGGGRKEVEKPAGVVRIT